MPPPPVILDPHEEKLNSVTGRQTHVSASYKAFEPLEASGPVGAWWINRCDSSSEDNDILGQSA